MARHNLVRCKHDGNYFGRGWINGKLIRRSLESRTLWPALVFDCMKKKLKWVYVQLFYNPLDPNSVGGCWQDPLNYLFHPGSSASYYCGNYFGDTPHVVDYSNGVGAILTTIRGR